MLRAHVRYTCVSLLHFTCCTVFIIIIFVLSGSSFTSFKFGRKLLYGKALRPWHPWTCYYSIWTQCCRKWANMHQALFIAVWISEAIFMVYSSLFVHIQISILQSIFICTFILLYSHSLPGSFCKRCNDFWHCFHIHPGFYLCFSVCLPFSIYHCLSLISNKIIITREKERDRRPTV